MDLFSVTINALKLMFNNFLQKFYKLVCRYTVNLQTGFCLARFCSCWNTAGAGGSGSNPAAFPLLPYKENHMHFTSGTTQ